MEATFSGYCRTIDSARLVFCEEYGGETEIDCDYETCPHAAGCPIGKQITEFLQQVQEAGTK